MIGTPIAGAVYDIAGNYNTSFYIASASFVASTQVSTDKVDPSQK